MKILLPKTLWNPPIIDNLLSSFFKGRKRDSIEALLDKIRRNAHIALNLGCGQHSIKGHINCDLHNSKADLIVDVRKISSVIKKADLIEAHHLLEHLSISDSTEALKDWLKILEPEGYIILSAPDFEFCLREFLRSNEHEKWNSVIKMIYGSQEHDGMYHKSALTPKMLKHLLDQENVECKLMARKYPERSTPSFLYVGIKKAKGVELNH